MQGTADFHHHVAHPFFPHPDGLFEHAAAFDTAIDMFDAHPSPRYLAIARFLLRGQLLPARLLRRLEDVHAEDASDRGGTSTASRWRKASTVRQGASPKVRRVLRNTGSNT